jgi:phosphoglycerol transferase MdoB-like AlkP superfamily enzyme
MYRRPAVYQHFGLDKFIAMEDMYGFEFAGSYISDKSFTQEIINQFESTNQPQFIFTLSMQNHMPYEASSFSNQKVTIQSPLQEKDQSTLQTYVSGINLSDQYYQFLKDYLKKSKKPTIILFYGDHLPFLNNDFAVYKNLNFVPKDQQNWSKNDYQNMYTTPITVWSNYETNLDIASSLSPNFLSLEILKLAKIEPQYQFSFLQSLSQTDKILNKYLIPKFSPEQLKNYELIQYDLISGKQYGLK